MSKNTNVHKPVAGLGRLVEPFRILLDNRSATWLVGAFAAMTLAEWGYVTALAVDAFRLHGSAAVGLVGFRLFVARRADVVAASRAVTLSLPRDAFVSAVRSQVIAG